MEGGGAGEQLSRYNPYQRPKRNRTAHGGKNSRGGGSRGSETEWFSITVFYGAYETEGVLIKNIESLMLSKLDYKQYFVDGNHAIFYVRGITTAQAVFDCSRQITSNSGLKLVMMKRPARQIPIGEEQIVALKKTLTERYDQASGHLNLSCLYHDPKLTEKHLKFRIKFTANLAYIATVMKSVFTEEQGLRVVSIDLSSNQLHSLDGLYHFIEFSGNVKKLDLSKNNISKMTEMRAIISWDLTSLSLDDNPICAKFESMKHYVGVLREYFPNLIDLDSKTLSSPDCGNKLPIDIGNNLAMLPNDAAKQVFTNMVVNYFKCYDENRADLRELYHPECNFSLSIPAGTPRGMPFNVYFDVSRNFLKQKRKLNIINNQICGIERLLKEISNLPKTRHILESFIVDITMCRPDMIGFTLHGLFYEGDEPNRQSMRAFVHNFVCQVVVNAAGEAKLLIINDLLHIRNSTVAERRCKSITTTNEMPQVPTPAAAAAAPADTSSTVVPSAAIKEEMIAKFCAESTMIREFSVQCLEANAWDFVKAAQDFHRIKGQIPPHAFQQK